MIDVSPFIEKLDWLREWINYNIDHKEDTHYVKSQMHELDFEDFFLYKETLFVFPAEMNKLFWQSFDISILPINN